MPLDDDLLQGLENLKLADKAESRPQSTAESKSNKTHRKPKSANADTHSVAPADTRKGSKGDVQSPADRSSGQVPSSSTTFKSDRQNVKDSSLEPRRQVRIEPRRTDDRTSARKSKRRTGAQTVEPDVPDFFNKHLPINPVRRTLTPILGRDKIQSATSDTPGAPRSSGPAEGSRPRPTPSQSYLDLANQEPVQYESTKAPLLVILDLNGALLHRPQRGGSKAIHRPGTQDFIRYLSQEHYTMVWSSARPENVNKMCKVLFNNETAKTRIAVWNRDNFALSASDYGQKVQVYKQLSRVWRNTGLSHRKHGEGWIQFDQTNTVLLDDSREKAASEPFNLVEIESFEGSTDKPDTLWQVRQYLETLRSYTNVSAYIRKNAFKYEEDCVWQTASLEYFEDVEASPPSNGIDEDNVLPRGPDDPPLGSDTEVGNETLEPEQEASPAPALEPEQKLEDGEKQASAS